jgi:hypothetical protein
MKDNEAIKAFPLCWPSGWARTKHRASSPYKVTTDVALEELLGSIRQLGGRDIIVSSNVPIRRDGTMYRGDHAEQRISDPGVAVYWTMRDPKTGKAAPKEIPCDHWYTVRENVRALGMAIDYIRGLKRCGAGEIQDRAFEGFARLPETAGAQAWWEVLGVSRDADARYIRGIYRTLAAEHHPDKGGDSATMARINDAYRQALAERAEATP